MRNSILLLTLLATGTVVLTALSAQSALEQLKVYTESAPAGGKAGVPPAESKGATAKPPNIVGIRLGMPVREAYTLLQTAYPNRKLDTTSAQLPTIAKPVLDGFSLGFSPVPMPDERINVNVTLPPNQQLVWRVQRHLGRQKIYRANVIASLREKYGKETVQWNGGVLADDQHASEMWWILDEQGRPAKLPSDPTPYNTLCACRTKFSNYSDEASPQTFQPGNRWFSTSNLPGLELQADWCNSAGIVVAAYFNSEEIVTSLDVEMFNIPLAVRSAKAQMAWLNEISKRQQQLEVTQSKQAKPKL